MELQSAVADGVGGVVMVWRGRMSDAPARMTGRRRPERTRMVIIGRLVCNLELEELG